MGTAAPLPLRRGRARVGVKRLAACHLRWPPHPHLPPRRGEGAGCITFSKTRAERQLKHDPRISIDERYAGRDEYLTRLAAAARELVGQRYLLQYDVAQIVDAGGRHWAYTTSSNSLDREQLPRC
jgi:hypothetical protein